jgi:hypothetical protein
MLCPLDITLFNVLDPSPRTFKVQLFAEFDVYNHAPEVFASMLVVDDGAPATTFHTSMGDVRTPFDMAGELKVPLVTLGDDTTGLVRVLLVRVSEPVRVTGGNAHSRPVAVAEFAVSTYPFDPTDREDGTLSAVAVIMSPLLSTIARAIAPEDVVVSRVSTADPAEALPDSPEPPVTDVMVPVA